MGLFFIVWFFVLIIGTFIGAKKGEGLAAFLLCFFFSLLGLIFVIFSKGNRVDCPFCKESINKLATVCPHCQKELPITVATAEIKKSIPSAQKPKWEKR